MDKTELFYRNRIAELDLARGRMLKRLRLISVARLLSFLFFLFSIFVILPRGLFPGIGLALVLLIVFLVLIKRSLHTRGRYEHILALLLINNQELQSLSREVSAFDAGVEFIDHEHAYSYDMDLFGEGSLFLFINRTISTSGKRMLADLLQYETLGKQEILNRQEAVKELAENIRSTQNFRAGGMRFPDSPEDIRQLRSWLERPATIKNNRLTRLLVQVVPALFLSLVVLAIFYPVSRNYILLFFLGNLAAVAFRLSATNIEHALISKRLNVLKKYAGVLKEIEGNEYNSEILRRIHAALLVGNYSAGTAIQDLTRIVSAFDSRLNILAAIFLEGVLLWDYRCMLKLDDWKKSSGRHLNSWIMAIAEYDSLVSLANFSFNHPDFCFPGVDDHVLIAKELGHVLIPKNERVANDFEIRDQADFVIITGANMAGKSTFLRTITTNLILAMSGAPVCASFFSFRPMKLFSSMRTSDSLSRHESYFYAELKRLKELLDRLRAGEKLFIVLDEILKGTNSTDKQRGSYAALEQILHNSGTGIVATHDLELAKIESRFPDKITNMCFEIEIDRARISFDYKLRPGITTKMNASLLMEQMGIIERKK
jgi:DNA mismatch repair ATPase MutS